MGEAEERRRRLEAARGWSSPRARGAERLDGAREALEPETRRLARLSGEERARERLRIGYELGAQDVSGFLPEQVGQQRQGGEEASERARDERGAGVLRQGEQVRAVKPSRDGERVEGAGPRFGVQAAGPWYEGGLRHNSYPRCGMDPRRGGAEQGRGRQKANAAGVWHGSEVWKRSTTGKRDRNGRGRDRAWERPRGERGFEFNRRYGESREADGLRDVEGREGVRKSERGGQNGWTLNERGGWESWRMRDARASNQRHNGASSAADAAENAQLACTDANNEVVYPCGNIESGARVEGVVRYVFNDWCLLCRMKPLHHNRKAHFASKRHEQNRRDFEEVVSAVASTAEALRSRKIVVSGGIRSVESRPLEGQLQCVNDDAVRSKSIDDKQGGSRTRILLKHIDDKIACLVCETTPLPWVQLLQHIRTSVHKQRYDSIAIWKHPAVLKCLNTKNPHALRFCELARENFLVPNNSNGIRRFVCTLCDASVLEHAENYQTAHATSRKHLGMLGQLLDRVEKASFEDDWTMLESLNTSAEDSSNAAKTRVELSPGGSLSKVETCFLSQTLEAVDEADRSNNVADVGHSGLGGMGCNSGSSAPYAVVSLSKEDDAWLDKPMSAADWKALERNALASGSDLALAFKTVRDTVLSPLGANERDLNLYASAQRHVPISVDRQDGQWVVHSIDVSLRTGATEKEVRATSRIQDRLSSSIDPFAVIRSSREAGGGSPESPRTLGRLHGHTSAISLKVTAEGAPFCSIANGGLRAACLHPTSTLRDPLWLSIVPPEVKSAIDQSAAML